ncbi:Flavohemoprotein [Tenacibaculum sp. 190524A02b]|uniref:nitric oxide dioxygenase n=1 Tax=Tenacibaculum vairaonense TaxID=3137860 RepID=A0ABP1FCZ9_9FLAO
MIDSKTVEIIKSTVPVLEVHGEEITKVFYKRLFKYNPELRSIFNMTHQKKGTQQKVLANAVFKYASFIDKPEMLGSLVEAIVEKHTSLSITKEMYPIVGENLLKAIKEVLGDAATDEIMMAWEKAYGVLATILINKEESIYKSREQKVGGYRGKKEYIVIKKEVENTVVTSFYLKRKDGLPVPSFKAGQYIALTVEIPDSTHRHTRNYSLSDITGKDYLRISVKKEEGNPDGIVSNFLHNYIEVGDVLELGMPSGEFVLNKSEKPLVLIGAGIGITPLMSMYKETQLKSNRQIIFIQCALNSETHSFRKEIVNEKSTTAVVYSNPLGKDKLGVDYDYEGFLNLEILQNLNITKNADFYFCGPTPFMKHMLSILSKLEVATENIHYEFFGPIEELV